MKKENIHRQSKRLFTGELMTCVICGIREFSNPSLESQWRALEVDGDIYYACPKEFPPDGANKNDFKNAYLLVFTKILLERIKAVGGDVSELEQKFQELYKQKMW